MVADRCLKLGSSDIFELTVNRQIGSFDRLTRLGLNDQVLKFADIFKAVLIREEVVVF